MKASHIKVFGGLLFDFKYLVFGIRSIFTIWSNSVMNTVLAIVLDDGTEKIINTKDTNKARGECNKRCDGKDVYYGVRKVDENQFHCKCFKREAESFIAEVL